jgi:hypothetical protein
VIKTNRQREIFPESYLPVDDAWLLGDAAQRNIEGMAGERDTPAGTFPKHANRRYTHRPYVLRPHLGIHLTYPPKDPPADSEEKGRQERKRFETHTLRGLCHVLSLGCPDFVMHLSKGLAIGCSDGVRNGWLLAIHVTLNLGVHVHILKEDKLIPTFAIRLHGFALIDRFCQAGNDERRERQGLPGFRFVLPKVSACPGYIDFEQAMDHGHALD